MTIFADVRGLEDANEFRDDQMDNGPTDFPQHTANPNAPPPAPTMCPTDPTNPFAGGEEDLRKMMRDKELEEQKYTDPAMQDFVRGQGTGWLNEFIDTQVVCGAFLVIPLP